MNLELTESQSQFLDQVAADLVAAGIANPTPQEFKAALVWRLERNAAIIKSVLSDSDKMNEIASRIYREIRGE